MKPSKFKKVHRSEFGFNGNLAMVSYVPKQRKVVVLLRTLHDDKAVDEASAKKKLEMIQYYNSTKGGVDIMDQMVHNYTCKHQSRLWPMVLW